ncbi:MAG TPA: hypothetical protein GXX40_08670 [Firmicutes bacterium]|nr:hypothetical protein [Bacillota bacterium]
MADDLSPDRKSRIAEMEAVLRSNPADVRSRVRLAQALEGEARDLAAAIEVLHQGLDVCVFPSEKALLHYEASTLLMANNQLVEAKREIEDALILQPNDPFYWDRFILIGCRLGLHKEVLQRLSEWEEREPGRYAVRRCKKAVQRFRSFSRARLKTGFSYKEEIYGLYGAAALGAPEDDGIDIWKYYFYVFDEYDTAHVLFRFVSLVEGMGIPITSVVPAKDGFSLPIALAMADMLRLPVKHVDDGFRGERPILVKAWGYETQTLMEDRARIESSHPERVCSFVFSGTRIFRHEIPPDFVAVETVASLSWESDVDCSEDSPRGRMNWAKAEEYAKKIVSALDAVREYEQNIDKQVEWYVKKHPYLACLEEPTAWTD